LNFTRALARGTLSEILGSEAIQIDKLMRTIGITKRVE
jgi:acyl-homoserine lactone acylase PvdQ